MNGLTSPFGWLPTEKGAKPAGTVFADERFRSRTRYARPPCYSSAKAWAICCVVPRQTHPVRLNSMTYETTDGSGRTHGDGAPKGDS